MNRHPRTLWLVLATCLVAQGCLRHAATPPPAAVDTSGDYYYSLANQIDMQVDDSPSDMSLLLTAPPRTVVSEEPDQYLDLSLEDIVRIALSNSRVFRDLGGVVLRAPEGARTTNDPAVVETDPRFGIEAALSAFDAGFSTSAMFEKNDRALNNVFFGGGTRILQQDFHTWQTQLYKTGATGTQYAIKNYTQYDANNAPGNSFGSAYTTWFDVEARHPLLQGGGIDFNRIAGPKAQPGAIQGVVIARLNSDIALADFEVGARNFVSDIENAYWDLYYGYRDLDSRIASRDAALDTWRRINALFERGRRGGEAEKEAQAREQFYRFQEDVQNALHGRLVDGTRTHNGSAGGTFRGSGGIYVLERRLRLIAGLPINDEQLLRPSDEPLQARVVFDWDLCLAEALQRRTELRRQKTVVMKKQAELEAHRNFLLPQLDAVGRYRWRGFGKDFLPNGNTGPFNNAVEDLTTGDFQEWQVGFELSLPIGFRKAYTAVRNSEVQLARERSLLQEQERFIVHDLSNALSEVERAYALLETSLNRRLAAEDQIAAVQTAYEADNATLDALLDAHRRHADADSAFYKTVVEYQLAVKNVQHEKGTLLDYNGIHLHEGAWPAEAYQQMAEVTESE